MLKYKPTTLQAVLMTSYFENSLQGVAWIKDFFFFFLFQCTVLVQSISALPNFGCFLRLAQGSAHGIGID